MSPVFQQTDPIVLFQQWFKDAEAKEPSDPNAMSLATVNRDGKPSVRIVLMRAFDQQGLDFYTNYNSRKAQDIAANANAAICFHWKSLARQVRAEGKLQKLDAVASDAYFNARAYESRVGAWASSQSEIMPNPGDLPARFEQYRAQYPADVPRPPHWGGYKLLIDRIEFWQEKPHRLHDRELFERAATGWTSVRLYP